MADESSPCPLSGPPGRRLLLIFAIIYLITAKGYVGVLDTTFSLRTADSFVTRGRLDIPPAVGFTLAGPDGRSYSKYGIGLAAIFVPVVALSHGLAAILRLPESLLAGFLVSFLNLPFALLTIVLFTRLLARFGADPAYARLLSIGLALGTLCWAYAVSDFSEGMQAAFFLMAVYGAVVGGGWAFLGGMGLAALALFKLSHVALIPIFVGYSLCRPTVWQVRVREAARFLIPVALALVLVAWLNAVRFGSPLESGYGAEARQFIPAQLPYTLPRLLGSLDKGLFVFCPVLAAGLVGWPLFFRRYPREAALCGALVLANLLLAGSWHAWEGGWCWGPRLLVPTIPLWLLPACCLSDGLPSARSRAAIVGLVLMSSVAQAPTVLVSEAELHHIRYVMLSEVERESFPADWPAGWRLLGHKLTRSDEVYSAGELGVPGDRRLDLTRNIYFGGVDVWAEHLARLFRRAWIRWLPLIGLVAVLWLVFGLSRHVRRGLPSP